MRLAVPRTTTPRRPATTPAHRALMLAQMFSLSDEGSARIRMTAETILTTRCAHLSFEGLVPWAARIEAAVLALPDRDVFPVLLSLVYELLDSAEEPWAPLLDATLRKAQHHVATAYQWHVTRAHEETAAKVLREAAR